MSSWLIGLGGVFVIGIVFFHFSVPREMRGSVFETLAAVMSDKGSLQLDVQPTRAGVLFLVVGTVGWITAVVMMNGEPAKPSTTRPSSSVAQPVPPVVSESYEESVRRAWREAESVNSAVDKAQDDLLKEYARKAVSHETSSASGVRIDTFLMANGASVICRTTVRNDARATSCR